ncbi:MAG: 4-(cytidine 5'-diphospho)-2-C-methyl-D-erythritol kinase [Verrucomicrobiota bacterium]
MGILLTLALLLLKLSMMSTPSDSVSLHCPAKVNLMLSVHGRREDGFHTLSSVVAPLAFGDQLSIRRTKVDRLICSDPKTPTGPDNLVLKAAAAFRRRVGDMGAFEFSLEKRIPMGAGLGGGSSNAAIALIGMNRLLGEPLDRDALMELAAEIGSDCPFFIDSVPAVMRGRGEIIEPLDKEVSERLIGLPIALFRPDFSIETAWAYSQLIKSAPDSYEAEKIGLGRIDRFKRQGVITDLLFNSFEEVVGKKYLALPTMLEDLRIEGFNVLLSGSGSCCFALGEANLEKLKQILNAGWGDSVFWVETKIC